MNFHPDRELHVVHLDTICTLTSTHAARKLTSAHASPTRQENYAGLARDQYLRLSFKESLSHPRYQILDSISLILHFIQFTHHYMEIYASSSAFKPADSFQELLCSECLITII